MSGKTEYVGFGRLKEAERRVAAREPEVSTPEQLSRPETEQSVAEQLSIPQLPSRRLILTSATDGYQRLPNLIVDDLLPRLHPHAQLVYLHLWRLCQIKDRGECLIGFPALAKRCNLSRAAVIRAVDALEEMGLVERLGAVARGANAARGNRYRVRLPEILSSPKQRSSGQLLSSQERRKESEKKQKGETAPVAPAPPSQSDPRALAKAFVSQVRHDQPGITPAELWPIAVRWAAEMGVDPALLGEAIGR